MLLDPHALHIYTDGSCYQNPGGNSGCAAIVEYPDHLQRGQEQILDFGCAESTVNRMELLACIRALYWIRENSPWSGVSRVQIVTDSLYVKENLPRATGWKKNDWRNQYGEPRENADLWKQLLSARAKTGIRVDFEWAPGKKTEISKRVDKAAKAAAKRGGFDVDDGFGPGTIARSMVKGPATRFAAQGQAAMIRPYRQRVMHTGENKVRFDVFSEKAGRYTESCYAFATPPIAAQLHRQHLYRAQFNANLDYPQILEIIEEVTVPPRSQIESEDDDS